ncbi:hypothetical protein HYR82_01365 [Candidatus Peregrinibacteria bacterium]|nr:hypothetical protein [Candidatus Peregrinibacteria bacterium]
MQPRLFYASLSFVSSNESSLLTSGHNPATAKTTMIVPMPPQKLPLGLVAIRSSDAG